MIVITSYVLNSTVYNVKFAVKFLVNLIYDRGRTVIDFFLHLYIYSAVFVLSANSDALQIKHTSMSFIYDITKQRTLDEEEETRRKRKKKIKSKRTRTSILIALTISKPPTEENNNKIARNRIKKISAI